MQPMPDLTTLLKIAQSPAGKKLLSILQSSNPAELETVTAAAAAGNLEDAKQKISAMLSSKEAQDLLKELERQA